MAAATRLNAHTLPMLLARAMYRSTGLSDWTTTHCCCCCAPTAACKGGDYSTERNGTERNDGLNYGTERFLKLKLATYHC